MVSAAFRTSSVGLTLRSLSAARSRREDVGFETCGSQGVSLAPLLDTGGSGQRDS